MFTGLIEDVGVVEEWQQEEDSAKLTVMTRLPLRVMDRGASIAVNGACLTIVEKARRAFTVDVSPETLKRTNLKTLRSASPVNLERPLRLQDRLGGHLVTGHVDGLATIEAIKRQREFIFFTFRVSTVLVPLIVTKGSVAVDGISLTVNDCKRSRFSVAIIPFTLAHTNLRARGVGDKVNIETDLIGKYVQNFLQRRVHT
jgi:riboflavin synthase